MKIKIAIIGAGNMGGAIADSIKRKYNVIVSDIDKKKLKKIRTKTTTDNKKAVTGASVVILAVKPQNIKRVLDCLKGSITKKQLIISIAAGIPVKVIENKLGKVPVVRVMPNTPLMVGKGMSVLFKGGYAKASHFKTAEKIFSEVGKVLSVKKESLMDAVTAVSGSGPAYVYLFIELLIKSARKLGLSKDSAKTLVYQTFDGALALLEKTGKEPDVLRKQVTSRGGTTEAAHKVFDKMGIDKIIHKALQSAHKRSKQLSK